MFETSVIYTTSHYIICLSAQPIFTNDNSLTQYGEFGRNVDINVYVYSIPKYTTLRWYRGNTPVTTSTKYIMSETPAIVNDTFHGKDVQLGGYSVMLTITNLKESDFNVSYRLHLSYDTGQTVQYSVLLESASEYLNTTKYQQQQENHANKQTNKQNQRQRQKKREEQNTKTMLYMGTQSSNLATNP